MYDVQTWEAGNKICSEGEGKEMHLCGSRAVIGERGVLCSLRNLSEGSLCILYCNCMLQYMQVVLRAENHCMEGTVITVSVIALEETMPGAVFGKRKLGTWL